MLFRGCCNKAECFCLCDDGFCQGGCCTICNCCCFKDGLCKEPIFEYGILPCPNYIRILLDVRFVNSIEEALDVEGGTYVGTTTKPFKCSFTNSSYGYFKAGERFEIVDAVFCKGKYELDIINKTNGDSCGKIIYTNPRYCGEEIFEVNFPDDASPLEKFMIISSLFMMDYDKCFCIFSKEEKFLTLKRKFLPGLPKDFS